MAALTDDEVARRLGELPGWERRGQAIVRDLRFDNFIASIEFADRLVPAAEEMNHHPDLAISGNRVTVSLTTHSAGALTEADFDLAARIDALA